MDNLTANMSAPPENLESVLPETQEPAGSENQDSALLKTHVSAELTNPESATPENQESAPLQNSETLPLKPREYGPLKTLETHLELFIENMRQIEVMVTDFQPQTQTVLTQKINGIVTGLQELNYHRAQVDDVYVPLEVVYDYIDLNRNPHQYTKDVLLQTLAKNEDTRGRVESFKKFKARLLVELFETFPDEMNLYRAFRDDTMPQEDEPSAED